MGHITNLTGAAEVFGVSPEAVRRWIVTGAPYISKPGRAGRGYKVDIGALADWRIEREREKVLGAVEAVNIDEARRRKAAAEAGLAEHDLAIKRREAVSVEDAVAALDGAIGSCRARLLGLGANLGPRVAMESNPAACRELVDAAVSDAIGALSELDISEHIGGTGKPQAEDAAKSQPVGATAKAQRKRVGGRGKKTKPRKQRRARSVSNKSS